MARPPKVKINLRLTEALKERVERLAELEDVSVNTVLVKAVENYLPFREAEHDRKAKRDRGRTSRVVVDLSPPLGGVYELCPCGSGKKWKFCHGQR